jgi:hypothetical protein
MSHESVESKDLSRVDRLEVEVGHITESLDDLRLSFESSVTDMKDAMRSIMTHLETRIGSGVPQSAFIPPASEVFGRGKVKAKFERRISTFEDMLDNSEYLSPKVVMEKKEFDGKKLSIFLCPIDR